MLHFQISAPKVSSFIIIDPGVVTEVLVASMRNQTILVHS